MNTSLREKQLDEKFLQTLYHRNRLWNGCFRVDQMNNGALNTPTSVTGIYVADNFKYMATQASKLSFQKVVASLSSFPYSLKVTSLSSYTPLATDYFYAEMFSEGMDFADMLWGTSTAQLATVSFVANVSVSGNYSFSIKNADSTRSYVFSKTLSVGENYVSETIPGDITGTWKKDKTDTGLILCFNFGCGDNYTTSTERQWLAGNYINLAGTVQLVSNPAAIFEISGVQVESSDYASKFQFMTYSQLALWCQRYYEIGTFRMVGSSFAASPFGVELILKLRKDGNH